MSAGFRGTERRRVSMSRVVVFFPSGLTLGNLFFGIFAIISASRGEFERAVLFVVLGGVCDAFDGRVARATKSGSRFGEELDSLVDAITFGLAPGLITYFAVLNREGWAWLFVFIFAACAVIRLARFNVTQAGGSKSHFQGLPSPAAGGTLATYHWFTQTELYNTTIIGDLPWHEGVKWVMLGLAILMISDVRYPAVPKIGFGTWKGRAGLLIVLATIFGVLFLPREFFFPAGMLYVLYGLVKTVLLGLWDRRENGVVAEEYLSEAADEDSYPDGVPALAGAPAAPADEPQVVRRKRKRRRGHGDRPTPPSTSAHTLPRELGE